MGRFSQPNSLNNSLNQSVVGLGRDGVINTDLGKSVTRKQDFIPIEKSIEAVALIRIKGHRIVIISNQGGIIKNELTEQQVDNVHKYMFELLGKAGCRSIDGLYYSTSSHRQDLMAKPSIGMFKRAEQEIPNIKFSNGFYVGDKLSDLKAAYKIGATPILVRTGHGLETEKALKKFTYQKIAKHTKVYDNLWQFAQAL